MTLRTTFYGYMYGELRRPTGFTETGETLLGDSVQVRFSIVWQNDGSEPTSIRTDKAPSKSRAREMISDLRILVSPQTVIGPGDQFSFQGLKYLVRNVFPRRELEFGTIHHKQVDLDLWPELGT